MIETWIACSDVHIAPPNDPRCDTTLGWAEKWSIADKPKIIVGDGLELAQFSMSRIILEAPYEYVPWVLSLALAGNHDPLSYLLAEFQRGDTLFLHGHQFDPWIIKLIEPVAMKVGNFLEKRWPDVDVKVLDCFKRLTRTGREAKDQYWDYVVKAARYAKEKGASQIVFGHLHCAPFGCKVGSIDGIRVIQTGCCIGGKMDFVPIYVEV